jgi:hypothetical protein
MKFFTPELFIKYNSSDDDEADRADEKWEAAIRAYREHLAGLRDQMPSQVKKLADLCLHDAEFLACDQPTEPFFPSLSFEPFAFWSGFAILSIRQGNKIVSLIYLLWDRVRKYEPCEEWPFSERRTHWLYDEVDVSPNERRLFFHRVLLSDGVIMEIPFHSALIHSFSLEAGRESDPSRRVA